MDRVSLGTPALPLLHNTQAEGSTEVQGRGASELSATDRTAALSTANLQESNRQALHQQLDDMFQKYRKPTPGPGASAEDHAKVVAHNSKIDDLVSARANLLAREGENLESFRKTMDNGHSHDKGATRAMSFVAGMPFALVAIAQHIKPNLVTAPAQMITSLAGNSSPLSVAAAQSFIGGAQAVVADQVSTAFQGELNKDALFMKAPPEKLHDFMLDAMKDKEPTKVRQAATGAAELQTFSARNVVRNGLDTYLASKANQPGLSAPAQAAASATAANVKTGITSAGGILAGMATGEIARMREERAGIRDAAQLFARKDAEPKDNVADETDWYEAYKAAKESTWTSMLSNGTSRLGNATIGTLSSTLEGVRSLGTAGSVLANGGFSTAFAGVGAAQKAATMAIDNPLGKAAADNAVSLAGSAAAFGVYGAMGAVGQKLADQASEWYDKDNHAAPKAAVRDTAVAGATIARDTAVAGATMARDGAVAGATMARDTAMAGANLAMDGVRATGNFLHDIGESAAHQASELRQRMRPAPPQNDAMEMV